MLECFFIPKKQKKLPVNKTREAINKKGLRVRVQREEMKCSVDGEKEVSDVVQGANSRAKEEEKLGG